MITDITMHDMQPGALPADDNLHVVMFYGPTCGPCKATMPHFIGIADYYAAYTDRVKFYRIDAWNPEEQKQYCAETWKIEGVPTFKIFGRGQVIHEKVGGSESAELQQMVIDGIDEAFKRFGLRI